MPSAQRVPVQGMPHELTFRVEEGLPFVPTRTLVKIFRSKLAAALSMYAVRLITIIVMGNHVHLLLLVDSPNDLPGFAEYFKRETAHAINNLLGRNQRTVWKDGYDSVVIIDHEKLLERLAYFYLNPVRAGLVESIDDYPGLSTWGNGYEPLFTISEPHIPRESIPALTSPILTDQQDLRLASELGKKSKKRYSVDIDTLCWMECWECTRTADREEMAQQIRDLVYREERRLAGERKFPVIGAVALRKQSMLKPHTPKKFGNRMLCMGTDVEQRKMVIGWFKALFKEREELRKTLSPREFLRHVFPGFFRAGGYMDANLNPLFVPI